MQKVLIANRGEIAVRVIRACADYGVRSVAVYADPDADALHVRRADEAWALPGSRPADTYLNIPAILAIAERSGADAVHPGYGFLSESAEFAQAVLDAGLIWIGPTPATIEELGDKVAARKIAERVGAPLVTGTADPVSGPEEVLAFAREHGLPIAIKAAFGGGGRGLRVAHRMDEVAEMFDAAQREAITAFGRGECFVEQFLSEPRHIEAQILADNHGNVLVVGTRDCSLQRRNQKLIEEAPAPFLTDEQRERIHSSAAAICAEAGYRGAGTVEFLLSRDGTISFLEVNTRLQVEHPVTEETSGIDLVIEQLRIADGLALSHTETPTPRGHAFEFRINAEDPGSGFLPTPGLIETFNAPSGPGVRVDTGVVSGSTVPGTFDSLMAKLIVTGADRDEALRRARRALAEFEIAGVASVLPFDRAVVEHPDFTSSERFGVFTQWIETSFAPTWECAPHPTPGAETTLTRTFIEIDGKRVELGLPSSLLGAVSVGAPATTTAPVAEVQAEDVTAPMAGVLTAWSVADGAVVAEGEQIAVIEAMKMETPVLAHRAGELSQTFVAGGSVNAGTVLGRVEA